MTTQINVGTSEKSTVRTTTIGSNVRKARKALGWSIAKMAHMSKMTPQRVLDVELHQTDMHVSTLVHLSRVLQVSPEYLLRGVKHI